MIAVYWHEPRFDSPTWTMYVVKNISGDHAEFIDSFDSDDMKNYPFPPRDVMFFQNDELVDHWNPLQGEQKDLPCFHSKKVSRCLKK